MKMTTTSVVFQQAGPWGIVALVVGAVVFGYLVPRPLLKETRRIADIWKEAYEHEREGRVKAEEQRDALLVGYAQTANQVISALPAPGRSIPPAVAGRNPDPKGESDATVAV